MSEKFICAHCNNIFKKGWSDTEANAEAEALFHAPIDDPVQVCTTCYEEFLAWGRTTGALDQERARLRDLKEE